MNQQIKHEWVAALRSGGVEQCKEQLNYGPNNAYCCLGVLCEMAVEAGIVTLKDEVYTSVNDRNDCDSGVLPRSVMKWAGLHSNTPKPKHLKNNLVRLNDTGHTFSQIADIIEEGF